MRIEASLRRYYLMAMGDVSSTTLFSDLPALGVEVLVTCQKCGHERTVDGSDPRLKGRRVTGARYRCDVPGCRGIGLPTLRRPLSWSRKLAEHARSLKRD